MYETDTTFKSLVNTLSPMGEVQSIGRSGGRPLPASPAGGDIDVFLYCDAVPSAEKRRAAIDGMGERLENCNIGAFGGGRWGTGDLVYINGIETWLMYFTMQEAAAEVDAVLAGKYPDKLDNYFYPTGRCAMYLGMEILCDKTGFLATMKNRLAVYPETLSKTLAAYHLGKLGDVEDLERAVMRSDALFYHFALDIALDHFLQALFAVNKVFFPSRKRSMEYIGNFMKRPARCEEQLLEVVRLGGSPEGLGRSYGLWQGLVEDVKCII